MYYIVLDLEFNQDFPSLQKHDFKRNRSLLEIIQIGAIKLDKNFNTIGSFNRYIKPRIFLRVSEFITELTGITTEQLMDEKEFPEVYHEFIQFIGSKDSILCIGGLSDIRELFKNTKYHKIDDISLPRSYINLQPYTSKFLGFSSKRLLSLEYAVNALGIKSPFNFHDALNDAYYTAEIFKKIFTSSIKPNLYDPNYVKAKPIKIRKVVDYGALNKQFEKMYNRPLTHEETEMIRLAYLMGKTKQFLKVERPKELN